VRTIFRVRALDGRSPTKVCVCPELFQPRQRFPRPLAEHLHVRGFPRSVDTLLKHCDPHFTPLTRARFDSAWLSKGRDRSGSDSAISSWRREELMRGDSRVLFLGWLADFDADEWRDSADAAVIMPPIPAGLDRLSPAVADLIKYWEWKSPSSDLT